MYSVKLRSITGRIYSCVEFVKEINKSRKMGLKISYLPHQNAL